jgi:WD40 repeat protein
MTDPLSPRRDVRRDTLVSEVAGVAGVPVDSVIAVANEFRAYGRHMLMPLPAVILEADSRLDISHESLLRQWSTLREWAREEGTNAREFVRLRDEAQRERSEEGELLSGRALARAQDWLKHAAPTPAWAERYAPPGELDATLAFIEKSEDQASRRKEEELLAAKREALARGARRRNWILGGGLVFATVFAAIIFTLWRLAASGLLEAEKQRQIADDQRDRADNQAKAAIDSANVATLLAEKLSLLAHDLKGEKDRVEAQNEELDRARVDAHTNLLTVSAARALPNDAALATLLARAAVAERPSDARALRMLRDSVAAHTPSIQSEVKVPRLRNYIPGKDKRLWLDFSLSSASLSPLHDSAITPSEADAVIWSTITGSRIQTLRGHEGVVGSAIFSPDGRFAVTTGSDNSARVWDVATGKELKKLTHGAMINGAVFNRNGTLLVTLGDDSRASLWTVGAYEDSRCELRVENSNFILASYSHDQHYLATVTHRNRTWQAQVWNIAADGCPQIEVEVLKQLDNIKWASFSESGAALGVVTEEGNVLVLSVPDWKEVSRFEPLTAYPRDSADSTEGTNSTEGLPPPPVAWSTDGRYFATAGGDNTVYISEIKPNPPRVPMRGHKGRVTSISFAPRDAALLTTSQDGTARLWALGPDKRPVESLVLTGHTEAVGSGAFSPGGNRVVTAGDDGNARVWTPLYALREWRRQDIRSAAYSADGRHIWVAGVERA